MKLLEVEEEDEEERKSEGGSPPHKQDTNKAWQLKMRGKALSEMDLKEKYLGQAKMEEIGENAFKRMMDEREPFRVET